MELQVDGTGVSRAEIEDEIGRIVTSRLFERGNRLGSLLKAAVGKALDHNSAATETEMASSVFEKTNGFDPRHDPLVRVQFGRLRRKLEEYYNGPGADDEVLVTFPARGYMPAFRRRTGAESAANRIPDLAPNTLAVLPFANLTDDASLDPYCSGLTEELISALTHVSEVNVVSRTSAFQYRTEGFDVREAGKELGVDLVLEGSLRTEGTRARVNCQLTSAGDGFTIWSDTFDIDLNNKIETQEKIAHSVTSNVKELIDGKLQAMGVE